MLLEFHVKNYRSIKDEMVFSLIASKDKTKLESHTIETDIKSIPRVTKGAAVFGANASGKSNLLNSLSYFKALVRQSATVPVDHTFSVKPFLFDKTTKNEPTEFEITFIKDKIRYQYGVAMTQERITEEWLYVYKTAKAQHWFSRKYDSETQEDIYHFGPNFIGQKDVWKKATRKNSLFLSTAIQLNNSQLQNVYSWIVNDLVCMGTMHASNDVNTLDMMTDSELREEIRDFISSADVGISDISVISRKGIVQKVSFKSGGESSVSTEEKEMLVPQFHHQTEEYTGFFELQDESLGTQRLFDLAGPILDILKNGKVLIFDELNSSLHTILARRLVEIFHSKYSNQNGAQLIFSSHDTELLNDDLLRRDQIWFVEKDEKLQSTLYPLLDYSPRKSEGLEKGYLYGRYGAIPFLTNDYLGMDK
jgi:AAA15 family ATPase/GTPase